MSSITRARAKQHTLLLTARKLVGHALFHALKSNKTKDVRTFSRITPCPFAKLEAIRNIVKDVVVRESNIALGYHSGMRLFGTALNLLIAKEDLSLMGLSKPAIIRRIVVFPQPERAKKRHKARQEQ